MGEAMNEINETSGPGTQRAAAVLLGLGPENASQVLRLLSEVEVRSLALGARELTRAPSNTVPEALQSFVAALDSVGGDVAAGNSLLRDFVSQALGEEVARRTFDGVVPPPPPDEALGPVAQADPEALAMVLQREQTQTVALVLSSLDAERGSSVLQHLPEAQRAQVLKRMASVESVAPEMLREVGQALSSELRAVVAGGMRKVDGRSAAIEILRRIPSALQGDVVKSIETDDPALGEELRSRLFTFDDLTNLGDRDVQLLIRDLDAKQLATALKGASPAAKEKMLKNMSTRAAEMLSDDLAAMGPVKLSEVEKAQAEVLKVAFRLSEQGRITIVGGADKLV
jgi:flagellar motor switch protein FliG